MRKYIYVILFACSTSFSGMYAASFDDVLRTIERNNLDLKSAREEMKIKKLDDRIEGNLADPEVEFEYLFGNKAKDYQNEAAFGIKQSFDFPTVYYHRNKVLTSKDSLTVLTYQKERQEVLLEAKLLLIELVCLKKQQDFQTERYNHAVTMNKLYEKKFKEGASSIIDINKIKLELLNSKSSFQFYKISLETCVKKLETLNGGELLDLTSLAYDVVALPLSFDEFYSMAEARNADLRTLNQSREVAKKEVSLAKSMALPKLSLGYKTEIVGSERLRGVMASVSIPLWANKNTVKRSKNQMILSDIMLDNARVNLRNELLQLYQNAQYQKELYSEYGDLDLDGKMKLLEKSLNAGQISLLEYFNELIILFDSQRTVLDLERDLQISYAQLMRFAL